MSRDELTPEAPLLKRSLGEKIFQDANVKLEAFPDLFLMEAMTGLFGLFFAGIWFIFLGRYYPAIFLSLWPFAVGIGGTFLVMTLVSLLPIMDLPFTNDFSRKVRRTVTISEQEERTISLRVRFMILGLSVVYGITCAFLIWLTGGVRSPFVPFYVMTFALTVTYTKAPSWFWIVFLYFFSIITIACRAAAAQPPLVDPQAWNDILGSKFETIAYYAFIALSLLVPTISSAAIAYRNRERGNASIKKSTDNKK
jgi:hypothetical protein